MSRITHTVLHRQRRRNRRNHSVMGLSGLGCSMLVSLLAASFLLSSVFIYADLMRDLPSLERLPLLLEPPNGLWLQPTQLVDRTGQHTILTLLNPAATQKKYLTLSTLKFQHLPDALVKATIAAFDPNYWSNPGYSLDGVLRGTHPTLTQQMVSAYLLGQEPPGLRRNIRERILAAEITARFGREKLLEWYLNSTKYGTLLYGADAAARAFFGKTATDLSLAEAAVLVAASQAPGISPQEAPQVVLERQEQILHLMLAQGMISPDDALQASQAKINFKPSQPLRNEAAAFTNLVLEQLNALFPMEELERGGWRIVTTLDKDLQDQAACASVNQIARLKGESGDIPASGGNPCPAARLLPTLSFSQPLVEVPLVATIVAIQPTSGEVLAMVGDSTPGLDPAHLPGRPPGTLLTPFIYLTAFSRGLSPATLVWDIPASPAEGVESEAVPAGDETFHGPIRLRTAFVNDYLGPASTIAGQMGPDNVFLTASQLGLMPFIQPELDSLVEPGLQMFDTGQITLLRITHAFSVFSNPGLLNGQILKEPGNPGLTEISPVSILRVEDNLGKIWLDWSQPQSKSVLSPQLAYLLTHVLSDEPSRWPSLGHPNPLEIGRPAGVKLGHALSGEEEWSVGYTPQIIVGVWLGQTTTQNEPGGAAEIPPGAAGGLWHAVIQYAVRGLPAQGWSMPMGISAIEVCDPSGLLPTPYCPTVVPEIFLFGNEPTQADNLYQSFQINRLTGRLATVFTPPELIQERVYLVAPPEAAEWAQKAGLAIPPDSYDVIYTQSEATPEVRIDAPVIFSHVRGQITFTGSATGSNFKYFRLQVGKGLNPTEWIQIGQDSSAPVASGALGTWDTQGLSGLYAVQLLVVREDQRVERTVTQVTVDNQPPELRILNPVQDQVLSLKNNPVVILQAKASDNLELARVEFYGDDTLVASVTQAPYAISWTAKAGTHTLRVRAIDLAGNFQEDSITFVIK